MFKAIRIRELTTLLTITLFTLTTLGDVKLLDKPREFSNSDLLRLSTAGDVKFKNARVIIDNDASFVSKLEIIRKAKNTLKIVYYIYSDDESSAQFSSELIKAAQRGVQVQLLVDIFQNYKRLDLFSLLEREGKKGDPRGRIEVKFYGAPTQLMLRDLYFASMPCKRTAAPTGEHDCSNYKWDYISKTPVRDDFFTRLLTNGIFGKDALSVKIAVLAGQQIDPALLKGADESDLAAVTAEEERKEQIRNFIKLLISARVKKDPVSAIQLGVALTAYGDQLIPLLDMINGTIPVAQQPVASSALDWEHATDYTHHKLLIADGKYVQLGGRNIENSYHMKPNSLTSKYIFMDTDVEGELTAGGAAIEVTFDRLYNFAAMSAKLEDLYKIAPNDFSANRLALGTAFATCSAMHPYNVVKVDEIRGLLTTCIQKETLTHPSYESRSKRLDKTLVQLQTKTAAYMIYARTAKANESWSGVEKSFNLDDKNISQLDSLSAQDLNESTIAYIENLNFNPASPHKRLRAPQIGDEVDDGKNIHAAWMRGLEKTCAEASKLPKGAPKKRIIFHNAYFIMPTNLLKVFSKMIDGSWDCKNVRVTFLTNSVGTTDLSPINLLARYQTLAFFNAYDGLVTVASYRAKQAHFEYFEYLPQVSADPSVTGNLSLHTKVTVMGDDIIIGSANADIKSYYMDTNNGFYIRNAKDFIAKYTAWVDSMINNSYKVNEFEPNIEKLIVSGMRAGHRTIDWTGFYHNKSTTVEEFKAQDKVFIDTNKWLVNRKEAQRARILAIEQKIALKLYNDTKLILNKHTINHGSGSYSPIGGGSNSGSFDEAKKLADKQNKAANSLNRLLQQL